ncbi:hypothetical protein C8J57DRAFT_1321339, partial [Mycena rebaudengoi]
VTGDVILSGSTIYFLLKRSHQALPETVGILNRFVRLVFQSAVPVTLCALANCICAASHSYNPATNATLLTVILTTIMLPKLYAISAMWTLNSRKELSSQFSSDVASNSEKRSRRQITTLQFRRHSSDGSRTVRSEMRAYVRAAH